MSSQVSSDTLPCGLVTRLTRLVLVRRRLWALLLSVGIFAAGQVSKRLSNDFPEPAGERSAA